MLERKFQKLDCDKYSVVQFWADSKEFGPYQCVHHVTINDDSENNEEFIASEISKLKQCPEIIGHDCTAIHITYHHRMWMKIPKQTWSDDFHWQYREETIRV